MEQPESIIAKGANDIKYIARAAVSDGSAAGRAEPEA